MSKMNKKKALLAASVAGLLAVAGAAVTTSVHAEDAGVKCAGSNACKGTGACGGKGSACAGKNACKGQGWEVKASAEECTKAGGTVVTPEVAS